MLPSINPFEERKMAEVIVCDENVKVICRACLRNDDRRMFSIYDQLEKDHENEEIILIEDLFSYMAEIEVCPKDICHCFEYFFFYIFRSEKLKMRLNYRL